MNSPNDNLINRVLNGKANFQEVKVTMAWFASEEGKKFLLENIHDDLNNAFEQKESFDLSDSKHIDMEYDKIIGKMKFRKRTNFIFKVAAVMIPLIILVTLFYQVDKQVDLFGTSNYDVVYVPKGEKRQIIFSDGTTAYLNANTTIEYPTKFSWGKRTIKLSGEAYFVVTSNKNRPFVIDLSGAEINVLGTSFNVKAYEEDEDIDVTLDNGRINFVSNFDNKAYNLVPGDLLVYNKETNECVITSSENSENLSAWKEQKLIFKNETMSEMLKKLERWYDVSFLVKDDSAYNYTFTFTSNNPHLENVLSDIEKISPVRFEMVKPKIYQIFIKDKHPK